MKTRTTLGLLVATLLVSTGLPAKAAGHVPDARTVALIQSSWQARIAAHAQTDLELARMEEKLMNLQISGEFASYTALLPAYMEMQAQRNPRYAVSIRRSAQVFVLSEQLKAAIADDMAHGRVQSAQEKQKQLIGIAQTSAAEFGGTTR